MRRTSKLRLCTYPPHGAIDTSAAFWHGDTAERILEERPLTLTRGRSRSRSAGPANPSQKTLNRLRRALPRRKTLEARTRLEARIADLEQELGIQS